MDYTDSATVAGWLEELYDEACRALPGDQKDVRCEALVAFLDSTLHCGRDHGGQWCHVDVVQEWALRALLGNDPTLRQMVWDWVAATIDQVDGDRTKQALLGNGLFDYLMGPATRWGAAPVIDWDDQGWCFVVDKILRTLENDRRGWVAFMAVDGNVERLHDILQEYLDQPISSDYAGPRSADQLSDAYSQWQSGLPAAGGPGRTRPPRGAATPSEGL